MSKNIKKINELIDSSLNIIQGDEDNNQGDIRSKETSDQKALRTRQRRNPLGGYGMGGSYGYYFGENKENSEEKIIDEDKDEKSKNTYGLKKEDVDKLVKRISENLLTQKTNENDIEEKPTLDKIPSFDSLKEHHPIVARDLQLLLTALKERGVDRVSDAIILDQIIGAINVSDLPANFRKMLVNKLNGFKTPEGNVVEESENKTTERFDEEIQSVIENYKRMGLSKVSIRSVLSKYLNG